MKLRFVGVSCALALCTLMAKAQNGGLYLNPIVTRASNSVADSGPFAFLGQNSKSGIFGGVDLGGYVDFLHLSPKWVGGIDMRDEIEHSNGASLNSFLLGFRGVYNSPTTRWHPYIQPSFGEGRSKPQLSGVHKTKFEYVIAAGADYRLGKHVDFRALEIGYGSADTVSSSQFNSSPSVPAAKLLNFSTGFVFRIP